MGDDISYEGLRTLLREEGASFLDNFSLHRSTKMDGRVSAWAAANKVEFAYAPFYASRPNRIESQFTGLCYLALNGTDFSSHREQARNDPPVHCLAQRPRHRSATTESHPPGQHHQKVKGCLTWPSLRHTSFCNDLAAN